MAASDCATLWRPFSSDDLELLRASFRFHAFPVHIHETYSIPLIETGTMGSFYRGEDHVLGAGAIGVVNPGEPHTGVARDPAGWTYRCFYAGASLLTQIASAYAGKRQAAPVFRETVRDPVLRDRLLRLHRRLERHAVDLESDVETREAFGLLIRRHAEHRAPVRAVGREPAVVARIRAYLEAHYRETVRLDQLAGVAGLNPVYLVRAFRKSVGMPPHAYQRQVRINRARALLAQGRRIADVAAGTGFADQSHLTRLFKAAVGVTPGRYRQGS